MLWPSEADEQHPQMLRYVYFDAMNGLRSGFKERDTQPKFLDMPGLLGPNGNQEEEYRPSWLPAEDGREMTVQTVSHFEITEKLGEGGAGVVYKARDVVLDRYVALKFLSPHLLESEDALRRFRTEARLISTLDHQNIETIYEVGEQDGRHFLVLEYLPGGPLGSKIRDVGDVGRKLSLRQVVDSALQIAEGLAYAHRKGIIHRDLKPANILCTQERKVKITDFGLAKYVLGEDTSTSGVLKGTLPYMSPEQVRGITLDHRTDIYSFGVLLHEMTTGERPFRGPNEAAILHAILDDPIPSLRKLRPEAPRELDSLARRAMAKDREQRYQRMEDVIAELTAIREEYFPGPDGLETTTVTDPGISDGPRPGISLPRKAIAVAALLLAAAGGLGWKLWPWPQRCLMAPDFFASCALPTEKHIGILEPATRTGRTCKVWRR